MMRSGLGATGCYPHLVDLRPKRLVIRYEFLPAAGNLCKSNTPSSENCAVRHSQKGR